MSKFSQLSGIFYVSLYLIILTSCKIENNNDLPVVETEVVTAITQTTAKSGGKILSDGGSDISVKGICWGTGNSPDLSGSHTSDGTGNTSFESILTGLTPNTEYRVRAYVSNGYGTAYGDNRIFRTLTAKYSGHIIADHTVVDKFDDIPQYYIDQVKKMWLSYAGESHAQWIQYGLDALESVSNIYKVNVTTGGTPEGYTTSHLRASRATWGDVSQASGWIYSYGEEDWFTNATAISRTKAGITYCNTHNLTLSAIGFGWCSDMIRGYTATKPDPVYGVYWRGLSTGGPEDRGAGYGREWGLDADDFPLTLNSISMDTYLNVTQEYIDYCKTNGYPTAVFFTTGPVDAVSYITVEAAYQGYLKHEHIRDYVESDSTRILFDYADILCYDDNGTITTTTWNEHTFPIGTTANTGTEQIGHITNKGAVRLAKAMWWMLARIAGWDGN